eukprot:341979-Prymnesium_polylepis.1
MLATPWPCLDTVCGPGGQARLSRPTRGRCAVRPFGGWGGGASVGCGVLGLGGVYECTRRCGYRRLDMRDLLCAHLARFAVIGVAFIIHIGTGHGEGERRPPPPGSLRE